MMQQRKPYSRTATGNLNASFLCNIGNSSKSISAPNPAPASHSQQHWLSGCSSTVAGDAAQIQNLDQQFLHG